MIDSCLLGMVQVYNAPQLPGNTPPQRQCHKPPTRMLIISPSLFFCWCFYSSGGWDFFGTQGHKVRKDTLKIFLINYLRDICILV